MNLTITGRHVQVSERLKEHAEKKVGRLEKYFNQIVDTQMIVFEEKKGKKVELIIFADGAKFYASEEGADFYSCIDVLLDKLDQQVKKYKEKMQDHKGRELPMLIVDLDTEEEEKLSIVESASKPLELKEAYLEMKMDGMDYLLFKKDTEAGAKGIAYSLLYSDKGSYYVVSAGEENFNKEDVAANYEFFKLNVVSESATDPEISLEKCEGAVQSENISQALQSLDNAGKETYIFYNNEVGSLGLIKKNSAGFELALPAK